MLRLPRTLLAAMSRLAREASGASAIEFALVGSMLVFMTLNMVDVGLLIIRRMQVDNAAEMAAQTLYLNCRDKSAPILTNCSDYQTKITKAVGSTSLGASITYVDPVGEKQCCAVNGALTCANYSSGVTACSALGGDASVAPGHYLEVTASYTYAPMFGSVSVLASSAELTSTATMRLK